MIKSAILSDCGTYRYELIRQWAAEPLVTWIMLNPSTADAELDDPTIRRCIAYVKAWGYGGLIVRNLYALRATDPRALKRHPDPVGPDNDAHLLRCADDPVVVCAWGAGGHERAAEVIQRLAASGAPLRFLAMTKKGEPRHPLYLRGDLKPLRLRHCWDEPTGGAS